MSASTHPTVLKHHFDHLEQQHSAERLGMWMFLVTEVLFFSGLFVAYTVYRYLYPHAFSEASHHLNYVIGAINTAVLICSSLTMVLAVRAAQVGSRKGQIVTRRKAKDAALSAHARGAEERILARRRLGRLRHERGEIVGKDVRAAVGGVERSAGPRISRTEIAR